MEDKIYVSFEPALYKKHKSDLLISKASLLKIQKFAHNLKVLARQKQDLKREILVHLSSILSEYTALQKTLPYSAKDSKNKNPEDFSRNGKVKRFSQSNEIQEELRAIQEKLKQLNG